MESLEPHAYHLAKTRTAHAIQLFRAGAPERALEALREVQRVFPYYTTAIAWQIPILDSLGEFAKLDELRNFSNNVHVFDLSTTHHDGVSLAQALALTVHRKVTFRVGMQSMPLVRARISDELSRLRCPVVARFRSVVLQCLRVYLRRSGVPNPHSKTVQDCWLSFWSTRTESRGSMGPHYHARSWVSWVFYPSARGAEHSHMRRGGELELGCIPERMGTLRRPRTLHIEPRPGRLVVFPSYLGHAVKPVKSLHPRISIAGDLGVMPRVADRGGSERVIADQSATSG